ncbi:MAG: hypothetical protein ACE5GC_02115 [Acidimicrobiia bacterium]
MRSRLMIAAAALVVLAAACGDDDVVITGDTAAPTTAATTAAPPTPAAPTTTTAAPTTTTAAPTTTTAAPTTTTTEAVNPLIAAIEGFVGAWTGTWSNTTFGSSGSADFDLEIVEDGVIVSMDLGGGVFGQGDPAPEEWGFDAFDLLTGGGGLETSVFGDVSFELSADGITIIADDVPAAGIARFEATGSLTDAPALVGTYIVTFDAGDTAEGTFEIALS